MRGFVRSVITRVALTSIAMATMLSTIGLSAFAETNVSTIPNYVVAAKQVAVGRTKQSLGQQLAKQLNVAPDLSRLMQNDQARISHTRASLNRAVAILRSKAKKLPQFSQNAVLAALNNVDQNTNTALNSASTFLQDVHKQSGKLAKLIVIGWKSDKFHFVEGGTTAILNDFGLPSYGSDPMGNARAENAYYAGKVIGDMLASIGGLALTIEGLTGMTVGTIGGLATSETIVGALVGVGVDVISIGEVAAGSVVMAASVNNFRSDDENLNSEQGVYSNQQTNNTEKVWDTPSVDDPNFASEQSLQNHYKKHVSQQGEFGSITEQQYVSDAKGLVTSKPGADILTYTRSNGDKMFYNKASNEFAVITNNGVIKTFFKPTNGIEYFYSQR